MIGPDSRLGVLRLAMNRSCWKVPESELVDLTPARARDLMVDCFFFAQHETFLRAKQKLGDERLDDASLRTNIVAAVRLAFKDSGGDFDRPTVDSLARAAAVLARKAESWGTPKDITQHHFEQISNMLDRMRRRA